MRTDHIEQSLNSRVILSNSDLTRFLLVRSLHIQMNCYEAYIHLSILEKAGVVKMDEYDFNAAQGLIQILSDTR